MNDGDFSAWNGHSPTQLRPTLRSWTNWLTTSTIDTVERNRSMSSSAIAMAATVRGRCYFVSAAAPTMAWAAANRAIGTRNGEQLT